ncbi:uncharacterized protein [Eurosta solidaginis]|uniref:uncharacterized protein n=1 Tax=Eurosta solidaginis TaxID=178769 RepID=UPI0035308A6B
MRAICFILFALWALTAANEVVDSEEEEYWDESLEGIQETGLILNSQVKKVLRNLLEQMPCGWPDLGIPPLAPYSNADLNVHLARSVVDTNDQLIRFRFDGLDGMDIKKLKVSYTFNKKVKYHFIFKELKATAHILNTNTTIDLLKELGVSVNFEGSGPLEFILHDLSIQGQFKYKIPYLWGSIKIYKFEAIVGLGGVTSNIGGILGNGKLNRYINDQIENTITSYINDNQKEISKKIEEAIVPNVNAKLKGHKIWWIFGQLGSSSSGKCNPEPVPWTALE